MSAAEFAAAKNADAAKKQASKNKKRGSHMTLAEAQRTGYKTYVKLSGDAVEKESKKGLAPRRTCASARVDECSTRVEEARPSILTFSGWLNPFADN